MNRAAVPEDCLVKTLVISWINRSKSIFYGTPKTNCVINFMV